MTWSGCSCNDCWVLILAIHLPIRIKRRALTRAHFKTVSHYAWYIHCNACRWLATPCKLSWQCFWISNILGVLEAPHMTPMKLSTIRFSSGKAESIGHEPPKLGLKGWNQWECFLTSHPNHSLANLQEVVFLRICRRRRALKKTLFKSVSSCAWYIRCKAYACPDLLSLQIVVAMPLDFKLKG